MEVAYRKTENVLEGIRNSNSKVIKKLYEEAYPMIFKLVTANNTDASETREILQQAMIVLYEKSLDVSFELTCAPSTFLYAISKNILLKRFRQAGNTTALNETHYEQFEAEAEGEEQLVLNERQELLYQLLETVGQSCKKILSLYYFEKLKFEEIAERLNYTNAANAKNQKYKCLKKLKITAQKSISNE